MNGKRVETLQKFLEKEPNDSFLKYALALEYSSHAPAEAFDLFADLISTDPEYTGTYYQFANLLSEHGHFTKAKEVFEQGIAVLSEKGETKALNELRSSYQNFMIDYD